MAAGFSQGPASGGGEGSTGFTTHSDTPAESKLKPGAHCLMTVTGRNFMVEILEVTDDRIRVSFPGIDYPVEGMLVDLEFHDRDGFLYSQSKVLAGPYKEGDGVLLERPHKLQQSRHRDSVRVPSDLEAEVRDQVHVRKYVAYVRNISTGGALIESPGDFGSGETLEMSLMLPDSDPQKLLAQVLYKIGTEETDSGLLHSYGTTFVGYEPGAGRMVTQYIWNRLKQLYPAV